MCLATIGRRYVLKYLFEMSGIFKKDFFFFNCAVWLHGFEDDKLWLGVKKNQFGRFVNVTKIPCILQEELILGIRARYFKLSLLRLVNSCVI